MHFHAFSQERYRTENYKILDIFRRFTPLVERASIDEAYLDLSAVVNSKMSDPSVKETLMKEGWKGTVIGGDFEPHSAEDIRLMVIF